MFLGEFTRGMFLRGAPVEPFWREGLSRPYPYRWYWRSSDAFDPANVFSSVQRLKLLDSMMGGGGHHAGGHAAAAGLAPQHKFAGLGHGGARGKHHGASSGSLDKTYTNNVGRRRLRRNKDTANHCPEWWHAASRLQLRRTRAE